MMNNNGRMILIVISCLVFSIFMRIGSVASQGMNGPPGAGTNYAIRMAAQGMKTHVPLNQGFVEGESMGDDFFEEDETEGQEKGRQEERTLLVLVDYFQVVEKIVGYQKVDLKVQ